MKSIKALAFFILSLSAVSCNTGSYASRTFTLSQVSAYTEAVTVKTTLSDDGTTILWNPKDSVNVMMAGQSAKFTTAIESCSESALFSGSISVTLTGMDVYGTVLYCGAYPYSAETVQDNSSVTITVPDDQTAEEDDFDPKAFPSLACSLSSALYFYNVCGGICFTLSQSDITEITLSGADGEALAGKTKFNFNESLVPVYYTVLEPETAVTLSAPKGETLQTGVQYYISALPQEFKNGFKMTFSKAGSSASKSFTDAVTIVRSEFLSYENIDEGVQF